MDYLLRHWRGLQGVVWSTLVNGLLVYSAASVLVAVIGKSLGATGTGYLFWFLLALLGVVIIWSLVGIARSAIRTVRDAQSGLLLRLFSLASIVLVATVLVLTARDLRMLFF